MSHKLLEPEKLITIRPHTRFVHFPEHTHDFVEIVYMVQGVTTHIVNGITLTLHPGELLLMGQNTRQEIYKAGREDIAVNFIIRLRTPFCKITSTGEIEQRFRVN